jgi:hypothetical protein
VFFADWRKAMKKRIKLRATHLATKVAQKFADYAGMAMTLVTTKAEDMYQIHMEKAQMRLAPRPCSSARQTPMTK